MARYPDPGSGLIPGHKLTLILGLFAIVLFIFGAIKGRRNKQAYGFEVLPMAIFVLKLVFIAAILGHYLGAGGLEGPLLDSCDRFDCGRIYGFITNQTVVGRHIYAVGGNPEAAELSGISVKQITYVVFGSMGMLSALSGILFTSRLQSATTTAGTLFELDAMRGLCWRHLCGGRCRQGLGVAHRSPGDGSLTSGMNLMGVDISVQYIARGLVLAAAVIFDAATCWRGG